MAYYQIKLRQDTAADWATNNPTLSSGELGYETDTGFLKIGDGSTAWNALGYFYTGTTTIIPHHGFLRGSTHSDVLYSPEQTGDIILRSATGYWKRLGYPAGSNFLLTSAATAANKVIWLHSVPYHTQNATTITGLNASIVPVSTAGGALTSSTVTANELTTLTGMTEPIKVRLSTKVSATLFDTKGDIITACGADSPYMTPLGSAGECLTADPTKAGGVTWATAGSLGYVKPHFLLSHSTHTDSQHSAFQTGDIIIRTSTGYWHRLGVPNSSIHYLRAAATNTDKVEWDTTVNWHTQPATSITGMTHRLISGSTHTDTQYDAFQTGDIILRSSTGYWKRLGGATTSYQTLSWAPTMTNKIAWKFTPRHEQGATTVNFDVLNYYTASTLNDVYDWYNSTGSGGRLFGGKLTALPSGGVAFSKMMGVIKSTDSEQGHNYIFDMPAGSLQAGSLTDNSINYIYCDYNSGAPTVLTTTNRNNIKITNMFNIGRAYKRGTTTEIVTSGICLANFKRRNHEMMVSVLGYQRGSGGDITQAGTIRLSASAGVFYIGSNRNDTTAVDTSAGGTFVEWWRNGAGSWNSNTGRTCLDNTHYDNNAAVLATLGTGRYGVHWVYICYAGHINTVFGQENYTLNNALAAARPSVIPDYLSKFAVLAAKIIIQKNAATFYQVASAYDTLFPMAAVPEHNSLTGLDGGKPSNEYYHLSAASHNSLVGQIHHTLLQHATHSDTRGGGLTTGDIIIRSATGFWHKLGTVPSSYHLLRCAPTATDKIEWDTVPTHTHSSTLITGLSGSITVISTAGGSLDSSTITGTQLSYLTGGTGTIRHDIYHHNHLGGWGGKVAHVSLTGIGIDDHHSQSHDINGATHTGMLGVSKGGTGSATYTASRAIVSHGGGALVSSTITSTELAYLTGLSGPLKASLSSKISATHYDAKGDLLPACADNTPWKLAVGTNGQRLVADSTKAGGMTWTSSKWTPITAYNDQAQTVYTATLTSDITGSLLVGMPIKFKLTSSGAATYYYAMAATVSSSLLTIHGASFITPDGALSELYYSDYPGQVFQTVFSLPSQFAHTTATQLIQTNLSGVVLWKRPAAYLCNVAFRATMVDSGAVQPKVNVTINAVSLMLDNSFNGKSLVSNTWVETRTRISKTRYDIQYGERLEITATKGTSGNAAGLTVLMTWVVP